MSNTLRRDLKQHHLQLLAIGGVIGAGFFMGAGKTISLAGPSVLLVYAIVGFFVFFTMRAMGELLLSNLGYRSFLDAVQEYLGERASFVIGWTYWLCWLIVAVANTVAMTAYAKFWYPQVPLWLPAFVGGVLISGLNLLPVKWFGESEFYLALIKVFTIVALIITGIYLVVTGFESPTGYRASLTNLYNHGELMPHGWAGFFAAFQLAVQASVGAEMVGAAAAETDNPRKSLPAAIDRIPVRVALFFVLSLAVIMMVMPLDSIDANHSPFVMMFGLLGLGAAAAFVNFVALSAAVSSANSGIYSAARMMYGLAKQQNAPKIFSRLNRHGTPAMSVLYSAVYLSLSFVLLYGTGSIIEAFTVISTMSSICFLVIWAAILVTYLKYRATRADLHAACDYKMPFGVVMSVITLLFFGGVLYLFSLQPDTAIALRYAPLWFIALLICYPIYARLKHRQAFRRKPKTADNALSQAS